jgi:hypothetical protein
MESPSHETAVGAANRPLSPREAILAMLYSPDRAAQGGDWNWAAPIEGKTKLVKELFLLDKETEAGKAGILKFSFTPGPYGPSSLTLTDTLDQMIRGGEVGTSRSPDPSHRATVLRLVGRVGAEAQNLWAALPDKFRGAIYGTKSRFREFEYRPLVSYVYRKYPDYATNSLIRDEILGEE